MESFIIYFWFFLFCYRRHCSLMCTGLMKWCKHLFLVNFSSLISFNFEWNCVYVFCQAMVVVSLEPQEFSIHLTAWSIILNSRAIRTLVLSLFDAKHHFSTSQHGPEVRVAGSAVDVKAELVGVNRFFISAKPGLVTNSSANFVECFRTFQTSYLIFFPKAWV